MEDSRILRLYHFRAIMHEKIVEILVFLMSELHANHSLSEHTFTSLTNRGYTDTEISAAFSWLSDSTLLRERTSTEPVVQASRTSFRILHDMERLYISPSVYGYLLQLFQLGIVNHDQLEAIIEQVIVAGVQPADMKTVRYAVASVLFGHISSSVATQRFFLNGSETIH
jgi:uncharacterized protein Smg (DUF494 family)